MGWSSDLKSEDLLEELREQGQLQSPAEVKEAYLERSGRTSVILANAK